MLILNCGGTFNKRYNPVNGELEVPFDNYAVEKICENLHVEYDLAGTIYKDSLDMDLADRKMITNIIMESKDDTFIVIHGTDSMSETAEFLDEIFEDRKIVLVGAMKPFEIDEVEATLNLGIAIGFLSAKVENGVYISMSGFVKEWSKLVKNHTLGKFEAI